MVKTKIRCSGCGRRIPATVSDAVVYKLDEKDKKRFYHQRAACLAVAQIMVMARPPTTWRMTFRHVDAGAN
jgi:macrodomain Ter protein organizer (MatP/YcbG family)